MSTVLEALDRLEAKGNRPGWPATEARSRYAAHAVEHLRPLVAAAQHSLEEDCGCKARPALAALQRDIEALGV